MNPVSKITHRKQEKSYSCGAASIAMLFNQREELIRAKLNTTNANGTRIWSVSNYLKEIGINSFLISLDKTYQECAADLIQTSYQFPIYCASEYRSRYFVKGRDEVRRHAMLICDGLIYDPAENKEMIPEEYLSVFNKSLIINSIIIIDCERPDYIKNFQNCHF